MRVAVVRVFFVIQFVLIGPCGTRPSGLLAVISSSIQLHVPEYPDRVKKTFFGIIEMYVPY